MIFLFPFDQFQHFEQNIFFTMNPMRNFTNLPKPSYMVKTKRRSSNGKFSFSFTALVKIWLVLVVFKFINQFPPAQGFPLPSNSTTLSTNISSTIEPKENNQGKIFIENFVSRNIMKF